MEETTRRGSNKRAHEEVESERPTKRTNNAQDVSTHPSRTSFANQQPQEGVQRTQHETTTTSPQAGLLSIDQLVQVFDSNHHAPEFFGRCTSTDSISDVDSEPLTTQNNRAATNLHHFKDTDASTAISELSHQFDPRQYDPFQFVLAPVH